MKLDLPSLCWLFTIALALHNLEEAAFLPAWSRTTPRWGRPVGDGEFRFAVAVLTLLATVLSVIVTFSGQGGWAAYLMAGYAFAMITNVLFPHVVMSIITRGYMPGLASALLLILPSAALLVREGFATGYLVIERFWWVGILVAAALLMSLPLLFAIGRRLFPESR